MKSYLSPMIQRFATWRPAWQSGRPQSGYAVHLVHGFRPYRGLGNPGLIRQAKGMVAHALAVEDFRPAYEREEIDKLFNDKVLAEYGGGVHRAANGDPKTTMDRPIFWADLLNNKMGGVIMNLDYLEETLKDGTISPDTLDEVLKDILPSLEQLKIIEDWIHFNADFMRKVFA